MFFFYLLFDYFVYVGADANFPFYIGCHLKHTPGLLSGNKISGAAWVIAFIVRLNEMQYDRT